MNKNFKIKISLILFFLFIHNFSKGQTVVSNYYNFENGSNYIFQNCERFDVNMDTVIGNNKFWDFSSLKILQFDTFENKTFDINSVDIRYRNTFLDCNFAKKDELGDYDFYLKENDTIFLIGHVIDNSIVRYLKPPFIAIKRIDANFSYKGTFATNNTSSVSNIDTKVVGYGSLLLPNVLYDSVLLLYEQINFAGIGNFNTYIFISNDQRIELFSINRNGTSPYFLSNYNFSNINNSNVKPIKLYPNPATDYFALDNSLTSFFVVELFDTKGRSLKKWINNSLNYDISTLSSGIYFVKVIDIENNIYQSKLIIK